MNDEVINHKGTKEEGTMKLPYSLLPNHSSPITNPQSLIPITYYLLPITHFRLKNNLRLASSF